MNKYEGDAIPRLRNEAHLDVQVTSGNEALQALESVGESFESYGVNEGEYIELPASIEELHVKRPLTREGATSRQTLILVDTSDNKDMNNAKPKWVSARLLVRKDYDNKPVDQVSTDNLKIDGVKDAMTALQKCWGKKIKGLARSTYKAQKFTEARRPVPGETVDQNFTPLAWA